MMLSGVAILENTASIIRCPNCLKTKVDIGLHTCTKKPFINDDGIYDLTTKEFYWNHLNTEQMDKLCEDAEALGWENSLVEQKL